MRTSTPDNHPRNEPDTLLLIGPPGGGKTSLMLRFPGLFVVNSDRGLEAPERWLRRKLPTLSYKYELPEVDSLGRPVASKDVWPRIKTHVKEACADPETLWVALDGLSSMNFHLINWCMESRGKSEMSQDLWIPYRAELLTVLNTVKLSGKNFLMTCHEEETVGRDGIVTKRKPLLDSKLRDAITGWFANVWRCTTVPGPGNTVKFLVDVRPTTVDELKCAYPDMKHQHVIDVTNPQTFDFQRDIAVHLRPAPQPAAVAKSA